jgi:oligopeptide/dipeptide ABC transporter ATP-binding protein
VTFGSRTRKGVGTLAVDGIDLHLDRGETIALIGESGSGKSATLLALAGLLPESARLQGSVRLEGESLLDLPEKQRAQRRGKGMGMVFQDPGGSLNPVVTVGDQIDEVVTVHQGLKGQAARARTESLLARCGVGDPAERAHTYPHQLSGGLKQRAAIAAALAADPGVILADEPTTALDATVQAQILDLLADLVDSAGVALLLVTHDMAVAAAIADRISVMYAGRIVEERPAGSVMRSPGHPYSLALREAALPFTVDLSARHDRLPELPGRMAPAGGTGCAFAPRCALVVDRCHAESPALAAHADGSVACWRAGEAGR